MRFEVRAAAVMGTLLPMLETMRRGFAEWAVDFTTMFEDYFAGALLLGSGWLAARGHRAAPACLLAAWAYTTGMMSSSFWGQLESALRGTDVEPHADAVLIFKLALWATSVAALALSLRRILKAAPAP